MGHKVFISFLGNNNYVQTRYEIDGVASEPVRFVQEALCDVYCRDWPEDSRILIFYTEESQKKNWLDGGQTNQTDAIEYRGLKGILGSKESYGNRVEGHQIPEGFSEEEVWQIFDTVYAELTEGDEIVLDVTHAFRSIPLFSTVLFHYSHFMQNTTLSHVCYGAFEKLGPAYLVKQNIPDPNDRIAPVLSLDSLVRLQTLTQVANGFKQFGKIADIGLAFESGEDKKLNDVINKFRNGVKELEEFIQTNKIAEIEKGTFVTKIQDSMADLRKKTGLTKAQQALLLSLEKNIAEFKPNGGMGNVEAAMVWALRYDMIQQAYTLARETVISAVLTLLRGSIDPVIAKEKDRREYVGALLGIKTADLEKMNYKGYLDNYRDLTDELVCNSLINDLRKPYSIIADNRNLLCHGKRNDVSVETFRDQLTQFFKECKDLYSLYQMNNVTRNAEKN